jgi:hypothetical protein
MRKKRKIIEVIQGYASGIILELKVIRQLVRLGRLSGVTN